MGGDKGSLEEDLPALRSVRRFVITKGGKVKRVVTEEHSRWRHSRYPAL